jgi:hypothetical protein
MELKPYNIKATWSFEDELNNQPMNMFFYMRIIIKPLQQNK